MILINKTCNLISRSVRATVIAMENKISITHSGCLPVDLGIQQWRTQEFCSGGEGVSTNSVQDRGQRQRGYGGGSPLVRGSGGRCNFVQEISFHIVKFS